MIAMPKIGVDDRLIVTDFSWSALGDLLAEVKAVAGGTDED